jgi:hypothetical protein
VSWRGRPLAPDTLAGGGGVAHTLYVSAVMSSTTLISWLVSVSPSASLPSPACSSPTAACSSTAISAENGESEANCCNHKQTHRADDTAPAQHRG